MKHLLGYLQLEAPTGDCVELINGARTLALMRAARANPSGADGCRVHPFWDERSISSLRAWNGNECWAFDSGQYGADSALWADPGGSQDLNPWEDSDDPRTAEVAGFLPDAPAEGRGLIIESPAENRVLTSTRVEPLEFIVTGTVVAGSERGEHIWLEWATRTLTHPCAYDTGWMATVFTHCPDESVWSPIPDPVFPRPADPSGEPTYTTWDDPSPPVVTDWTDPTPWPLDTGSRQMFDVRFVSIDPLTDEPLFPHCVGRRYAIRFAVGKHRWFDRPRSLATVGGAGTWSAGEVYSNPLSVGSATPDPDDPGPPGLVIPSLSARSTGLRGRPGRWSLPDGALREAALTPPRPATLEDRVIVAITNPSVTSTVYNARIRFWQAIIGQPHPNTQVGHAFYRDRVPEGGELRITEIGPTETLTFDGRTNRVSLSTPGSGSTRNVPGRVEGPTGTRVESPSLQCDVRYWVAVDLSADSGSYGDLDLEVVITAAEAGIPA